MEYADLLQPYLFHEVQDGALCAQHCLNNLMQGALFSVTDLSEIAERLDRLEDETRNGVRQTREPSPESRARQGRYDPGARSGPGDYSFNASRTGYFSLGVIEEALKVFRLTLVRWGSEEAKMLGLDQPGTASYEQALVSQRGYVFNLREHWYALRRFGLPGQDDGIWFNLNSMLPKPAYVGDNYLGLLLAESQSKDYNVFIVVSEHREGGQVTEADEIATDLLNGTSQLNDDLSRAIEASLGETKASGDAGSAENAIDSNSIASSGPTPEDMRKARLARFG